MASFDLCFLFILSSPVFFFARQLSAAVDFCGGSCGGQVIRFPFKLTNQPNRCGYPGFNLSCQDGQTILTLPFSGNFTVQSIDYMAQTIWLGDPDSCVPKRLLKSFSLSGSPFQALYPENFTFLNCSSSDAASTGLGALGTVNCLSNENYTVVAIPTGFYHASGAFQSCSEIATVVAPVAWPVWSDPSVGIRLKWKKPNCRSCERRGGNCQLTGNSGLDVGCSDGLGDGDGISKGAKYGLIFGLGVPFLFILGITICLRHKICGRNQSRSAHSGAISSSVALGPVSSVKGLDGPTIESYPMTLLGASRRLPNPSDNTCSICLSEYQAKEIIRTLPECQHYFHANCLDEWLRLNGTCPLCRNTPEA